MKKITTILLICICTSVIGNKIPKAYNALSIYDYFKAKSLFYKSLKKQPSEAAFGLATIYSRNDNPFTNSDSAAKYIILCKTHFKDTATYSLFHINKTSIISLENRISKIGFEKYYKSDSTIQLNYFLTNYFFANDSILDAFFLKRDQLILNSAIKTVSSEAINQFLLSYPQSQLYKTAQQYYYEFQYQEIAPEKTIHQLQLFISKHQNNPLVNDAEATLFKLTQNLHRSDSLYAFIKTYSTPLTKETAWKLLYSISVNNYSKTELTQFLNTYPDYPFNDIITKEISLSQQILISLKNLNDQFGYIDTLGNWMISPQFDDASEFSEGFAAVCKNDTCFYINKEGKKTSSYYFEETENYKDGIAIVKNNRAYFLINRSGQIISKGYEDINEASEKLYVCKLNDLYGAINAKGETIVPFNYKKLGNFKNNYAYYTSTNYGLVDITNKTTQAQWDWISDVDTNSVVIVKKENKFGLMTLNENLVLPTQYDYITYCTNDIYLVVKQNLYGFFNLKEHCFITDIEYNYNPTFTQDYYTNGKYFKLIKNEDIALIDANGKYSINYKTYSNLFFAKCDIIRIQKNNKYGYVDRKLKPITPVEFDKGSDYENNIAIVTKGNANSLIDKAGKAFFTVKNAEISPSTISSYLVRQNDLTGLINNQGQLLLNIEYESINLIEPKLYSCIKNNELYLYNMNTKQLKKIL